MHRRCEPLEDPLSTRTAETAGKLCKESVMPAVKFVKDQPDMIEGLAITFGGHLAGWDRQP